MRAVLATLTALFLLGGCARYEYDLIQPAEHARHIGTRIDQVVVLDPLEYRLQSMDNRLVMRVFNPTDDPIELLGVRSSAVDPDGQSHPLRSQTIAPQSFIKLIFPPPRPRVYDHGSSFGFGVGIHSSSYPYYHHHNRCHFHDVAYDVPRYFAVYDESDSYFWDWKGTGEARIILVFRRGESELKHEFTFRRIKM
jgi:hypothetical protein